jgi:hypothetical protein
LAPPELPLEPDPDPDPVPEPDPDPVFEPDFFDFLLDAALDESLPLEDAVALPMDDASSGITLTRIDA